MPNVSQNNERIRPCDNHKHVPKNLSQYCDKPKLEIKSAHSSVVHSVIIDRGEFLSVSKCPPKVVGVCSADGGSESVGDDSESFGRIGEVSTLLSYSSSASESAW